MDGVTKNIREGLVKEILYAEDLVLLGDDWKEVESRYSKWKKVLLEKGMKVNIKRQKRFVQVKGSLECTLASLQAQNVEKVLEEIGLYV